MVSLCLTPYITTTLVYLSTGLDSSRSRSTKRRPVVPLTIESSTTTTRLPQTRLLVDLLRDAGAKEVHVRIAAPEVKYQCHFGGNDMDQGSLISNYKTAEEIKDMIGADSLAFLSIEGLEKACQGTEDSLCMACFTGKYPVEE